MPAQAHRWRMKSVSGAKTIRGLERGLEVLQALQVNPISSLHDIHVATRIPKPSLLRILHTLERFGLVSRRLGDGRYRIGAKLTRMARRHARHDRVAEAAAPVLDRLCQKISWPSDLLVPAGEHMEIAETSQTHSPFLIPVSRIGQPVNWLLSAVGRVYLAHCPDKEREEIVQRLRKSDKPEDRLARDVKRFERILSETRQRGYGVRDPGFGGGPYGSPPRDDGLAAIAVPLLDRTRVHGSINILWIKTAFTIEQFATRYLADLKEAAAEIVESLRKTAGKQAKHT
jgi:IclR family transcriptional regulator, mhp operon transcriptional activator